MRRERKGLYPASSGQKIMMMTFMDTAAFLGFIITSPMLLAILKVELIN